MKHVHALVASGLIICGWISLASEAPALPNVTPPGVAPPRPNGGIAPAPVVNPGVLHNPPTLHLAGPCGVGQTQCFLGGGKVPPSVSNSSPDAAREKVCVFTTDPKWGCGTCTKYPLWKTEGAECAPNNAAPPNYRKCAPNWADRDGNRQNGCETWVPTRHADGWQRPARPANLPAAACRVDSPCPGQSPDIKCVIREGSYSGTCQWFDCAHFPNSCGYLDSDGIPNHGIPACLGVGAPDADSHGCGWRYPTCEPFYSPGADSGLCRMEDPRLFDADNDGHPSSKWVNAAGYPLGDDCDDGDNTRFPGNNEVCDAFGHDEDCNPATYGQRDADGDTLNDNACCNTLPNGARVCGTDCDDHNAGIGLSGKQCLPNGQMQVCVVDTSNGGHSASFVTESCGPGATCVPQPDHTGVCQLH